MNIPTDLKIIPVDLIPKGQLCPLDKTLDLYKLGLLMQAVCEKEKGIGLSAVQVGVPLNFFIVNYSYFSTNHSYRFFINCSYTPLSDEKEKSVEGCLSLRKPSGELRHFELQRFKAISIKGKELVTNPDLKIIDFELTPNDYFKIVFQHEIDHQNLITIDQIGKEINLWKG